MQETGSVQMRVSSQKNGRKITLRKKKDYLLQNNIRCRGRKRIKGEEKQGCPSSSFTTGSGNTQSEIDEQEIQGLYGQPVLSSIFFPDWPFPPDL